jgi:hypothetical protein
MTWEGSPDERITAAVSIISILCLEEFHEMSTPEKNTFNPQEMGKHGMRWPPNQINQSTPMLPPPVGL